MPMARKYGVGFGLHYGEAWETAEEFAEDLFSKGSRSLAHSKRTPKDENSRKQKKTEEKGS